MILTRQDRPNRPLRTGSSEGAFVFAVGEGMGVGGEEQFPRSLRRNGVWERKI